MQRNFSTELITCPVAMGRFSERMRGQGKTIALVPTMGCLHEGHLSLVRAAKQKADVVVVSIFVNPLQFGENEDLAAYPRPFARDLQLCQELGVDVVFHPDARALYPGEVPTRVEGGPTAKVYCGQTRPIHFGGVLTAVSILFHVTKPQFAFFGEKDFQQLFLVRQMCRDLHFSVEICGMPIVREAGGLAMSSRNVYLSPDRRAIATVLYRAIGAAQQMVRNGERSAAKVLNEVHSLVQSAPEMALDYAELVDVNTLARVDQLLGPSRLLLAAFFGDSPRIRLIDNGAV